jgi:hypothetical protein
MILGPEEGSVGVRCLGSGSRGAMRTPGGGRTETVVGQVCSRIECYGYQCCSFSGESSVGAGR